MVVWRSISGPLFQCSSSLILVGFILSTLVASTLVASSFAENSELSVDLLGLHGGSNGSEFRSSSSGSNGEVSVDLGNLLELFSGGIVDETLLWCTFNSWEDDELGLVSVESCSVSLELLSGGAGTSVVNSDSNSLSPCLGHLGGSELSKSETSAVSGLSSVLAGSG